MGVLFVVDRRQEVVERRWRTWEDKRRTEEGGAG